MDVGATYPSNNCGDFTIIAYNHSKDVSVEFIKTGYRRTATTTHIKDGKVKDKLYPSVQGVGYVGVGDYKPTYKGKDTKQYVIWSTMLQRCYSPKSLARRSTYEGCEVDPKWFNFQVFAKWFDENYVEGCELDKDIKVDGNKIYSEKTCMFVSHTDNLIKAVAKNYHFKDPYGESHYIYNLTSFCKGKGIDPSSMIKVSKGKLAQHKQWVKGG